MTSNKVNIDELTIEDLKELFFKQSEDIKNAEAMSDNDKLYLYKYYKQATVGNINIEEPGFFDFVGKHKYNAWKSLEDISSNIAMKKYILYTYNFI